jgi:hypothetical protein
MNYKKTLEDMQEAINYTCNSDDESSGGESGSCRNSGNGCSGSCNHSSK